MANIVAIVGRPNVGKSTLFNRLTGTRRAIVMNTAGTTRDRQYGKCEWCGKEFSVIDTGGGVVNSDDTFESEINRQVDIAIKEADVVLLVVDVNEGVTQFDTEVAHLLRQAKKPTVLAVPQGSAYLFRCNGKASADALVAKLHLQRQSDFGPQGFGIGVCSVVKPDSTT